jgi:hypothetical protein
MGLDATPNGQQITVLGLDDTALKNDASANSFIKLNDDENLLMEESKSA